MQPFYLMNSRMGQQEEFATLEEGRLALRAWITKQSHAGERVLEQETGQWSDSRVTVWIADQAGTIMRLEK